MGFHHVQTFAGYLKILQTVSGEPAALAQDLLISVTHFFRDPAAFEMLRHEAILPLVRNHADGRPIRVWVPGCATGEEAYSIAMLLLEAGAGGPNGPGVKIFATDVDDRALGIARAGRYPEAIVADVPPDRLKRFFINENGVYQVGNDVRQAVVFAVQNLLVDPPFSQLDLISCRNLLIYIEAEAQKRLIAMFHFALVQGGCLFIGKAETTGGRSDLFEPVSAKLRLFRRTGRERHPSAPVRNLEPPEGGQASRTREPGGHRPGAAEIMRQAMFAEFVPPSVLVDKNNQVLYFHGPTAEVLDIPTGEPRSNLLLMTSGELRVQLREALQRARNENARIVVPGVQSSRNGMVRLFRLVVFPIKGRQSSGDRLLAVSFLAEPDQAPLSPSPPEEQTVVAQLERELRITREDLQSTIQELESANEALVASNEEVTSMNEELQSTNEELETSKEELQSLNEELSTVNHQLQEKLDEVECFSNDLTNLLNSTDVATVFLDIQCRIRRFTPSAVQVFTLIPGDIGRPITDVTRKFRDRGFLDDVHQVLKTLVPAEAQVVADGGGYLIRRVLPYRTLENRIEGVVVTFTDVTQSVQASQLIAVRARQHEIIADISRRALACLPQEGLVRDALEAVAEALDADCATLLDPSSGGSVCTIAVAGRCSEILRDGTFPADPLSDAARAAATGRVVRVRDFASDRSLHPLAPLAAAAITSGIAVPLAGPPPAILAVYDRRPDRFGDDDQRFLEAVASVLGLAAGRRIADQATTAARDLAQDVIDTQRLPLLLVDGSCRIVSASAAYYECSDAAPEAVLGHPLFEIGNGAWNLPELRQALSTVQREAHPVLGLPIDRSDNGGGKQSFVLDIQPLNRTPDVTIVSIANVTARKREADELAGARQRAENASAGKSRFLAAASHDLRQPLQGAMLFYDLVMQHNHDPKLAAILNNLGRTLDALQQMMDTLLDISRLDAGLVDVKFRVVRLDHVIERLAAEFQPQAEKAGLTMRVVCSRLWVRTDPILIERILRNLIANAIRYTERGRVLVGCRRAGPSVRVQIRDTGLGIPADQLDTIFEEFHQVGNLARDRQKGLGLGLAIVHRLSALLGHPVTVRSTPGRGSVFEVLIPRAEESAATAVPGDVQGPSPRIHRPVVVVIEDDPYILDGIGRVLSDEGYEVVGTADPALLEKRLRSIDPNSIHCVVSDYRLPGAITGIEAIFLSQQVFGREVPGILITGDTSTEILKKARASGFTLLHKPVSSVELLAAIGKAR